MKVEPEPIIVQSAPALEPAQANAGASADGQTSGAPSHTEPLLQMQRTIGNQAVQRMLRSQVFQPKLVAPLLQRQTPGQPSSPSQTPAFTPTLAAHPPSATVLIGDHFTQKFFLLNQDEAPKGTTLNWGGGVMGTSVLKLISDKTEGGGKTHSIDVQARAPGRDKIDGNLSYQTPGATQQVAWGPEVPITVPAPTVEMTTYRRTGASGAGSSDVERMRVGERLVVHVVLGNVSKRATNLGFSIQATGGTETLPLESSRAVQPGNYELTFNAKAVGDANVNVKIAPADTQFEDAPVASFETHVEMDAQEFLNKTGEANTHIDNAYTQARVYMLSLSRAYKQAWTAHTDTLKHAGETQRLIGGLILDAALAFVPGGIGGVIGAAMKERGPFLADGVKDLAKWGMRKGGGAIFTPGSGGDVTGPSVYPEDPTLWESHVDSNINKERLVVGQQLETWQHKVNQHDPNFFTDFDPVEAIKAALTIQGQHLEAIQPVDEAKTAIDFEKGFWKTWLEKYAYTFVTKIVGKADSEQGSVEENVAKEIEDRVKKLGLDPTPYMATAKAAAEKRKSEWEKHRNDF